MSETQAPPAVLANDTDPIPAEADWSILDHPGVTEIASMAATKVGAILGDITTVDDQYQDAVVLLALNAETARRYLADVLIGERQLYTWLVHGLRNGMRTDARRAGLE